jgi:chromatin segregation and condensation protein Rec8/ScpA/Scc1 (kleisin family)
LETDKNNPEVAAGVFDLLKVFQDILTRHKEEVLLEIEREEVSMAEMLERLRNMVMSSGELNLRVFFERARTRRELVLAFLLGVGTGADQRSEAVSARELSAISSPAWPLKIAK